MRRKLALLLIGIMLLTGCGSPILKNTENLESETTTQNSEADTEQESETQKSEIEDTTESPVEDDVTESDTEENTEVESENQTAGTESNPNEGEPNDDKPDDSKPEGNTPNDNMPDDSEPSDSEQQPDTESSEKAEPDTPVVEAHYDVPKVYIYTNGNEINTESYTGCKIVIVEEKGEASTTLTDASSKIKIRGNSTSGADKKPFNIKFSEKTDVLGMGKNKKWSLLANCFDKTLIRNQVVFDVAKVLNIPYTPDYRVVDVYVDDVLQGCYLLVDSIEVGSTRVDIDTTGNEFLLELDYNPEDPDCKYLTTSKYNIKFAINEPELADLTTDQIQYVTTFLRQAESALASGNMKEIEKYFDIDSMASFYLIQEFFRNVDVATSSTRFHIKDGKIYGGPVWDFDLSAGNYCEDYYTNMYDRNGNSYAGLYATKMPWFGALTKIEEFQDIVNQKFLANQALFVNLYADNELGQNHIDETIDTYKESFDRNHEEAGWDPSKIYKEGFIAERTPDATYEANVEFYRNWLKQRNEWLLKEWGLD